MIVKTQSGKAKNKTHLILRVMACTLMLSAIPTAVFASNTAQIQITATVTAVCSVSAPAVVDLGEIPFTAFSGKTTGDNLTDFTRTFTITPSCAGTNNYRLTFTPQSRGGSCIGSDRGSLRFCLQAGTTSLDFSGANNPVYNGTGNSVTMNLTPQIGTTPSVGVTTGSLSVTISPL